MYRVYTILGYLLCIGYIICIGYLICIGYIKILTKSRVLTEKWDASLSKKYNSRCGSLIKSSIKMKVSKFLRIITSHYLILRKFR